MTRDEIYDQLCDAIGTRNQDHADDLRDKIMAEFDRLTAELERIAATEPKEGESYTTGAHSDCVWIAKQALGRVR